MLLQTGSKVCLLKFLVQQEKDILNQRLYSMSRGTLRSVWGYFGCHSSWHRHMTMILDIPQCKGQFHSQKNTPTANPVMRWIRHHWRENRSIEWSSWPEIHYFKCVYIQSQDFMYIRINGQNYKEKWTDAPLWYRSFKEPASN